MSGTRRCIGALSVVATLLGLGLARPAATNGLGFVPISLGTLPGDDEGEAIGINARGQIVGDSSQPGLRRAFLWTPLVPNGAQGNMIDLGTLGGTFTQAIAINSSGQVVGRAFNTGNRKLLAFLWQDKNRNGRSDPGEMTVLPPLPGGTFSEALAINDQGVAAGRTNDRNRVIHAVLWDRGRIIDLTPPKRSGAFIAGLQAAGINNLRQVVGAQGDVLLQPDAANGVPVLWQGGVPFVLPLSLHFTQARATAVNSRTQVAGNGLTSSGDVHAYRWERGEEIDIGTLGGSFSSMLFGLNNLGQISGCATTEFSELHAFFWSDTNRNGASDPGEMCDLGVPAGGTFSCAFGLNDRSQAAGFSADPDDVRQPFIWNPIR
jgi:probable HAF family extracellular repeat protein